MRGDLHPCHLALRARSHGVPKALPQGLRCLLLPIRHPTTARPLIQRARQSVLLGAGGEASLEPWITRSWQRCLAAGLHPGHKVVFNPISGQALRQLADESHALVQAARPVLDQLTRAIAGMRYFAMLTNARGVVIDVQGAVDRHDPRSQLIGRWAWTCLKPLWAPPPLARR